MSAEGLIPQLSFLIPVFPVVGSIIIGATGKKHLKDKSHIIAVIAVACSFFLSLLCFYQVASTGHGFTVTLFEWIGAGNVKVNAAFLVDQLTTIMLLVVTGVGLLVHIFSIGYMHGEDGYYRFFAELNLFMFSMLILIMGSSYIMMFLGWEGVGFCSYLLIGYYFKKKSAGDAAKKAFVVNRVGDAGFLMGAFFIFTSFGSFDYLEVFPYAHEILSENMATLITLCLFVGAMGKSAQIPLYVWLPDAMEGPTPVSALIHAATMVTAGVYMIVRTNVIYSMAPTTMAIVATVGALTALFAASMAMVQNDIKKVLAYSTISQLGYMFLACGVGAYISGVFHLMTHAFFKGLMFLGSGAVIYAMHHEQDMRKMGALRKYIPKTAYTFLAGTMAIAGVFPLAGFWSKDEILAETFKEGHYFLWAIAVLTAGMTAFYMFRLFFMTFAGECRVDHHTKEHLHEPPNVMVRPLLILAVLSIIGGIVPGVPLEGGLIHSYLGHVVGGGHEVAGEAVAHHWGSLLDWTLMIISVGIGFVGIALAYFLYVMRPEIPGKIAENATSIHRLLYNKYWVDEMYGYALVGGCKKLALFLWNFDRWIIDGLVHGVRFISLLWCDLSDLFDKYVIDGSVNGLSITVNYTGDRIKMLQSGKIQHYLLAMIVGICVIMVIARVAFF